ncbi:hypothetical protein LEP1GSC060_0486 [Leptospira weilii serovar Ranarum str. ICFT]|uniref:Uncharacterized protein n=1 Tax=Leptospira weilii serovar Ranarum str. ICFT TaxID=1218598 RepID=N1WFV1_9LEPT|nr:hypothetical protein LEP1GSC060_0486 [Leptospira weilii serovar Ranarum str. ICFT]
MNMNTIQNRNRRKTVSSIAAKTTLNENYVGRRKRFDVVSETFFIVKKNGQLIVFERNYFNNRIGVNKNPVVKKSTFYDFNFVARFHSASLFK